LHIRIFQKAFQEEVMRVALMIAAGLALGACSPSPATPSAAPPVTAAQPVPQPAAEPTPATPTPEQRIGAMNLSCGGESFRVAFEDTRAVVVNADGSNTELPKLSPDATPGVAVYSNGKMQFTKQGGGDTPTVIKYAKARMAPQDCAIAQN
jgi:hypothetical protein